MATLDEIALKYRTDKSSKYHNYTPVYEEYFEQYRKDKFTLLELGLGDKNSLNVEGESLFVWQEYFPNAQIIGIDNDINKLYHDKRIYTHLCDQTDVETLKFVFRMYTRPFIIIDDASHIQKNTINSFKELFPLLQPGGIYCIEDTVTNYWPDWGGEPDIYRLHTLTIVGYMFMMCHYVNFKNQKHFNPPQDINIPQWVKEIDSIHFHHNQIIIKKK